jgi:hypothetical protein
MRRPVMDPFTDACRCGLAPDAPRFGHDLDPPVLTQADLFTRWWAHLSAVLAGQRETHTAAALAF